MSEVVSKTQKESRAKLHATPVNAPRFDLRKFNPDRTGPDFKDTEQDVDMIMDDEEYESLLSKEQLDKQKEEPSLSEKELADVLDSIVNLE